jgi:succinate-semialdehyde dehydrogenase/glutarate-semialdehyde dehydrogenase
MLVSRSPATGKVLGEVPAGNASTIREAVARAREAQPGWAARDGRDRAECFRRLNRILYDELDHTARLISEENGKPRTEALVTEILPVMYGNYWLIRSAQRVLRSRRVRLPIWRWVGKRSDLVRVPVGVVGVITPWNFPWGIPMTQCATALIAGNTVVLKPSSSVPLISAHIGEVFRRAGFPPDVLHVVQGPGPIAEALIEAPVDHVVFTGSVATGRRIQELAAHRLVPSTLELGGKDPAIVLEDANLDVASSGIVWGAFANAGQTCASIERVVVVEAVAAEFIRRVVEKVERLRVGPDEGSGVDVGAITTADQLEVVRHQVEEALAQGARAECGGRVLDCGGRFYAPTVLTGVTPAMRVVTEETFGPVLPIMTAPDADAAIETANAGPFGLSASIWTRDLRRARALARRLEVGTVCINDSLWSFAAAETPWGGVKQSGLGRTHGAEGLLAMTRVLHVSSDSWSGRWKPWWYPYSEDVYDVFREVLRWFVTPRPRPPRRRLGKAAGRMTRKIVWGR